MMTAFYFGCGVSLIGAALSPSLYVLAVALFALGIFAAIYHPVGTAMIVENGDPARPHARLQRRLRQSRRVARRRHHRGADGAVLLARRFLRAGRDLHRHRLSPICGSRPGKAGTRRRARSRPTCRCRRRLPSSIFGLFLVVAVSAGLVFNTISVALPKIVDERITGISLVEVGGLTTAVFLCGAVAQLTVGRLVERFPPHILFAMLAVMQFSGVVWSAYAGKARRCCSRSPSPWRRSTARSPSTI